MYKNVYSSSSSCYHARRVLENMFAFILKGNLFLFQYFTNTGINTQPEDFDKANSKNNSLLKFLHPVLPHPPLK